MKTHCKRGHALEGDNLIIRPSHPYRECRACAAQRRREKYARARQRDIDALALARKVEAR